MQIMLPWLCRNLTHTDDYHVQNIYTRVVKTLSMGININFIINGRLFEQKMNTFSSGTELVNFNSCVAFYNFILDCPACSDY